MYGAFFNRWKENGATGLKAEKQGLAENKYDGPKDKFGIGQRIGDHPEAFGIDHLGFLQVVKVVKIKYDQR